MNFRSALSGVLQLLLDLPPLNRRFLLIILDLLVLPLSMDQLLVASCSPFHPTFTTNFIWLIPAVLLVGLPLYRFTGQYKGLTRYVGSAALYRLAGRNTFLVFFIGGCRFDTQSANASPKQLGSAFVLVDRYNRFCSLCLA